MSTTEKKQAPKQLSASERINRLEGALMNAYQNMDGMARELMLTKDALRLVSMKLEATIRSLNAGEALTNENISKQAVNISIEELAEKVNALAKTGVLVKSETLAAAGLLVARGIDKDGKVINPRIQFVLASQSAEVQGKLVGAKVGDIVELAENEKLEILETYDVVEPKQEEAPQTEANA